MKTDYVLGVKINTGFTMPSVLKYIEDVFLSQKKSSYICTTNAEFIMKAQEDSNFKSLINGADLSLPDGIGVVMAIDYLRRVEKFRRDPLFPLHALFTGLSAGFTPNLSEQRIAGMSLVYNLCKLASERNYSVFFLGGRKRDALGRLEENTNDIAQMAAYNMKIRFPGLNVIGATSAYTHNEKDDAETMKFIHKAMAQSGVSHIDILFVAYNFVTQEKWILRNMNKIPARLSLGVGRTIEHMALENDSHILDNRQRKTEWLMSLINTPWKIKRIAKAFPAFPLKVFLSSIKK
jgi:N-acetylglucosaminyldiphosphoundecaprenol N-acetyl-beta-D-mannosaminyltransferase